MKLGLRQQVKQGLITHDEARKILHDLDENATPQNNTFLAWLSRRKEGKVKALHEATLDRDLTSQEFEELEAPCTLNDHDECRKHEVTE